MNVSRLPTREQTVTDKLSAWAGGTDPRHIVIGGILLTALFAFEMFNFDTTRYALNSLLGNVNFMNVGWATILAIAFCAIDFAGLARMFTPEKGADEPKEVWYLMGAWLLGATMNAVMTWWAVSLTLLNHELGNEILSREQLLQAVPIFVAVLVWLTRILFIGSLTVAGEHLFEFGRDGERPVSRPQPVASAAAADSDPSAPPKTTRQKPAVRRPKKTGGSNGRSGPNRRPAGAMGFSGQTNTGGPVSFSGSTAEPVREPVREPASRPTPSRAGRVRRRPPQPMAGRRPSGMQAKGRDR